MESTKKTPNPKKPGNSGIVYCDYIPVQLSEEQAKEMQRRERAGSTYARVKLSNPNPRYRLKRGVVKNTFERDGNKMVCLAIETLNTCSENGCMTLMGTSETEDIWFNEDELEGFVTYDADGNEV